MLTRNHTVLYLPPTRLSTSGMNHTCFTPQPQSVTELWLVLVFRPAEGRRLSWPEWLVTNRGGLPDRCRDRPSVGPNFVDRDQRATTKPSRQ